LFLTEACMVRITRPSGSTESPTYHILFDKYPEEICEKFKLINCHYHFDTAWEYQISMFNISCQTKDCIFFN
jgi:hypothetical protein